MVTNDDAELDALACEHFGISSWPRGKPVRWKDLSDGEQQRALAKRAERERERAKAAKPRPAPLRSIPPPTAANDPQVLLDAIVDQIAKAIEPLREQLERTREQSNRIVTTAFDDYRILRDLEGRIEALEARGRAARKKTISPGSTKDEA